MDDIFNWFKSNNHIKHFINRLQNNSVLKVTSEQQQNNSFHFLDVQFIIIENIIETSVYIKPTDRGMYSNFSSHTLESYNISIIKTLVNRAIKGPSTLATLLSNRWPRFCGRDIYSRRKPLFSSFGEHTAVCGSSVRQAVARPATDRAFLWLRFAYGSEHTSDCSCSMWQPLSRVGNIAAAATCGPSVLVSATKTRPPVAKQSGKCVRALKCRLHGFRLTAKSSNKASIRR